MTKNSKYKALFTESCGWCKRSNNAILNGLIGSGRTVFAKYYLAGTLPVIMRAWNAFLICIHGIKWAYLRQTGWYHRSASTFVPVDNTVAKVFLFHRRVR